MKRIAMWHLFGGVFTILLFAVPSAVGGTVNGTGIYPNDHQNVQAAIELAGAGGTVILSGDFNFGADGGIEILQPNVTLMGGATGATITGQGKFFAPLGLGYLIFVQAIGCSIKDLTITNTAQTGNVSGIIVRAPSSNPADNPVVIQNNTIVAPCVPPPDPSSPFPVLGLALYMRATGCPMKVLDNTITGTYAVYARLNPGDVLISGNTLNSIVYGTYVMQNSRDCIVKDNTVYAFKWGQGLHVCTTQGYGKILISGNKVYGAIDCINIHHLGSASQAVVAEISNNYVEPVFTGPAGWFSSGVWGYANKSPLNVLSNTVRGTAGDPACIGLGVYLWSWDPNAGMDQENGAVLIKGNKIDMKYPVPADPTLAPQSIGMVLGDYVLGLSNVTVTGNKITGTAMEGIERDPHGKKAEIFQNDLSGLKTWGKQIGVFGRETIVRDNLFGFANLIPGFSTALEIASVYYGYPDYPMPYPTENCTFFGNDYRATGLKGWTDQANGCIILRSYADMGGSGTEVKNNLVKETGMFPVGTGGPEKQVFELKTDLGLVHDNRIVGMPAAGLVNPGIGQRLKAIRGVGGDVFAAGLGGGNGKKGMKCGVEDESLGRASAESPFAAPELLQKEAALPTRLELYDNYPNPFNPSTTIRFGLPKASYVKIEVFNALGQMVAQLADGELPAGFHSVRFDGSSLSSGLYFYRLVTGNVVETRKMLLLK
jgi:hypothetical protein